MVPLGPFPRSERALRALDTVDVEADALAAGPGGGTWGRNGTRRWRISLLCSVLRTWGTGCRRVERGGRTHIHTRTRTHAQRRQRAGEEERGEKAKRERMAAVALRRCWLGRTRRWMRGWGMGC